MGHILSIPIGGPSTGWDPSVLSPMGAVFRGSSYREDFCLVRVWVAWTACGADVAVPSFLLVFSFIRTGPRVGELGAVGVVVSVVFSVGGNVKLVAPTEPDAGEVLGVLRPVTFPDTVSASFLHTTAARIADSKDRIPVRAVMDPADI